MKKSTLALAVAAFALIPLHANSANYFSPQDLYYGSGVVLYKNKGENVDGYPDAGYRIPAVAALGNGIVIAASDLRYHDGSKDLTSWPNELWKTHLATKISYDGGFTWSDMNAVFAQDGVDGNDFFSLATDPAAVYDQKHDTVLMFGFRPNVQISRGAIATVPQKDIQNVPKTQSTDFIMFTSHDKGLTWEKKNITKEILDQVNVGNTGGKKYTEVLQGPGGGMFYQGKIYIPLQAWITSMNVSNDANAGTFVGTSGFMVSDDGGETWEVSKMLIPNIDAKRNGTDKMDRTSESNIFHHKGKIRLAVKNEDAQSNDGRGRLCFEYTYNEAKQDWEWVQVEENFLPKGLGAIETSSHSLSEDVYLVAYSFDKQKRHTPTLVTNTGAKIQLDGNRKGNGYTSISSDDDNIYVMYEGLQEQDPPGPNNNHSQIFKVIEWKHKEYAVLNTQMRNRAIQLNEIQNKFSTGESYIAASHTGDDNFAEVVGSVNGFKGGVFIRGNKNVEEDLSTVAEYDIFDVTLLAGVENKPFKNALGTMFVGYMNSAIDYKNGSENDVNSFLAGYRLDYKNDYFGWKTGFNFIFSENDLRRNKNEGLGKTAQFNSTSFSIYNELYKDFDLNAFGDLKISAGMLNSFFKRDGFREVGGEGTDPIGQLGANNAVLSDISLESHELFVKAGWLSKPISFNEFANLQFSTDLKYAKDVTDMDKWKEKYLSFTAERTYNDIGELYSGRDDGYFTAEVGAKMEFINHMSISAKGVADSRGEYIGKLEGKISI